MKRKPLILGIVLIIVIAATTAVNMRLSPALGSKPEKSLSGIHLNETQTHGRTPYQYLNLMLGNTSAFTLSYRLQLHETGKTEAGTFYYIDGMEAAVFTTQDEKGASMTVREVQRDGHVYYIVDKSKIVKRYSAPAKDFLFYRMMDIVQAEPTGDRVDNGGRWYTYIIHEDGVEKIYSVCMQNGSLKEMTYTVDTYLVQTYEFLEFQQEITDKTVFTIPTDYHTIVQEEVAWNDPMPPWWSSDGLSY